MFLQRIRVVETLHVEHGQQVQNVNNEAENHLLKELLSGDEPVSACEKTHRKAQIKHDAAGSPLAGGFCLVSRVLGTIGFCFILVVIFVFFLGEHVACTVSDLEDDCDQKSQCNYACVDYEVDFARKNLLEQVSNVKDEFSEHA